MVTKPNYSVITPENKFLYPRKFLNSASRGSFTLKGSAKHSSLIGQQGLVRGTYLGKILKPYLVPEWATLS